MYVSRLDRPWRETQFLFQGFEVTDQSMIDEIKQQTLHVYVLTADEEIKITQVREPDFDDIADNKWQIDKPTEPIEEELPVAAESYRDIMEMAAEIDRTLKSGGPLNLPRILATIGPMTRSIERNPDAYIWLARTRRYGSDAFRWMLRVSVWAMALARQLDLDVDMMAQIALGTLLMDAGFARVPREILNKTSPLTDAEWQIVKSHVHHTNDMLTATPGISSTVKHLIATHHERLDGSGYPQGLGGNAIPLAGQIAGIVDYFSGVTRPRPFKKAMSPSAALQLLYKQRETYFNGTLVDAFIRALGAYPTGSLVKLSTGEAGIISSQNQGRRLRPRVVLLLDANGKPYGSYPVVNLLDSLTDDRENVHIAASLADGEYAIDVEQLNL